MAWKHTRYRNSFCHRINNIYKISLNESTKKALEERIVLKFHFALKWFVWKILHGKFMSMFSVHTKWMRQSMEFKTTIYFHFKYYLLWCFFFLFLRSWFVVRGSWFAVRLYDSTAKVLQSYTNISNALEIERSAREFYRHLHLDAFSPFLYALVFRFGVCYTINNTLCAHFYEITRKNTYKKCKRFSYFFLAVTVIVVVFVVAK